MTNIVDGTLNLYMKQDYEDPEIYIQAATGFSLNIACANLTADNLVLPDGIAANKLEVKAMSDALGLNQLSEEQVLDQETSGVYASEGTSVCIMNSDLNPVRLACGGPKVNSGGSTYGGALTYSSTAGGLFSGPAAYRTNTFCDDYTGQYTAIDPLGEWLAFSLNYSPVSSPPMVNLYRWNGSNYVYNRNFMNFEKPKIYGNYIVLSNLSSGLVVYFFNGTSWSLQQTISTTLGITIFDIRQDKIHFLDEGNKLKVYTRSGTVWSLVSTTTLNLPMDSVINDLKASDSVSVVAVVRDNVYLEIYDSLVLTATFTASFMGGCAVTPDGNFIFYFDGSEISIVSRVAGTWTVAANKTACSFVDNVACNNNRLVAGRTVVDDYGRVNVFHINSYTNELVIADQVYADEGYNLVVQSNYKNVDIIGTDVNITNQNSGSTYINGSLDVLGNLDVGGSLSFTQVIADAGNAGNVSYGFTNDGDTGMFSTGDGNISWSLNGASQMSLGSSGLTVPKLISSVGAFTLNTYKTTGAFALVNTDWTNLKLETDVLIENSALVKSSFGRAGTNAGHRFTNSSSSTMKLMVTANIIILGTTRTDHQIRIQDDPVYYNQAMSPTQGTAYGFQYSSILNVPAGKYFEILVYPETATQINVAASSGINLQVYRLA